jgi:predicted tellurium resistance membrane protein TerC
LIEFFQQRIEKLMIEVLSSPEAWISFAMLAAMEIVLGIDNLVFITILTGRLPEEQQHGARRLGIGVALISRLALLFSLSWIMSLDNGLFVIFDHDISGKDIVLFVGGFFLIGKATHEMYVEVEEGAKHNTAPSSKSGDASDALMWILVQVIFLDIVFSLDSVITAVGMVSIEDISRSGEIGIMVAAMMVAVAVMMWFAGPVGDFVQAHASVRVLALSFLVLIGVLLTAEAFDQHIPKGYIYFAMAYAVGIELINMKMRGKQAASPEDAKVVLEPAGSDSEVVADT